MDDAIAERKLVCIVQSGDRIPFTIKLGRPYQSSDVDWACPVALDGLERRLADIHGIDAFQSLMLARKFAFTLLSARAEKGAKFVDSEDGSNVELQSLFEGGA
jgi:hypothetical protein